MITKEVTDKFAVVVGNHLRERFKDDFVFDPIIVERAVDYYGDGKEYLDIFIIYDGDYENLDPRWTSGLSVMLWPEREEYGITSVPSISFVEKSEWEAVYHGQYPRRDEF